MFDYHSCSNGVWHVVLVAHSQLWYRQRRGPAHRLKFLRYPYTQFKKTVMDIPWQRRSAWVNKHLSFRVEHKAVTIVWHQSLLTQSSLFMDWCLHYTKTLFPSHFPCNFLNVTSFLVDQCKESLSIFNYTTLSCRNHWIVTANRSFLSHLFNRHLYYRSANVLHRVNYSSFRWDSSPRPPLQTQVHTKPQTWGHHYLARKLIHQTNTWTSSRLCRSLWIPWSARIVE